MAAEKPDSKDCKGDTNINNNFFDGGQRDVSTGDLNAWSGTNQLQSSGGVIGNSVGNTTYIAGDVHYHCYGQSTQPPSVHIVNSPPSLSSESGLQCVRVLLFVFSTGLQSTL